MKVVVGICESQGKLLMGKRFDHDGFYGGYWEFPGGKVDPGETERQALIREFQEELRAEIEDLVFFKKLEWFYPNRKVELNFFRVKLKDGNLNSLERNAHSELDWVEPSEALRRPILPANVEVIKSLSGFS